MNERSDIEFPVWRKKVDHSFLNEKVTPIPKWLWSIWKIEETFEHVKSIQDSASEVKVLFEGNLFKGNVFFSEHGTGKICRFSFHNKLHSILKDKFLMTYMRSLEGKLRKSSGSKVDIEKEIPFWEFIDIEFDSSTRTFKFTCHYNQQPTFPELFKQLVSSPSIKAIDDYIRHSAPN